MNSDELPSYQELKTLTEEERSVIIIESLRTVITNQSNHLRHHWAITLVGVAAGFTGMFNLCVALLILFFRV